MSDAEARGATRASNDMEGAGPAPDKPGEPGEGRGVWADSPDHNLFYGFMRSLILISTKLLFRLEIRGAERVPLDGGVLFVANHASYIDPTSIACGMPRQFHFLAKGELFEVPLLGPFLREVNSHPIKRGGGDRAAIRQCVDILKAGHALLIFPEGTRTPDGSLQDPKPGAAMIALQAGVPVVPARIDGSFEVYPRGVTVPRVGRKLTVTVGEPFDPAQAVAGLERRERYEALGKAMMSRIAALGLNARVPTHF